MLAGIALVIAAGRLDDEHALHRGRGRLRVVLGASSTSASVESNATHVVLEANVDDVEFTRDDIPELFNALTVDIEMEQLKKTITLEVAQHLGDNMVRCISMQPTDGLVRGATVTDSGQSISVPVGDVVKGHVFNVLGDCMDKPGHAADAPRWAIHRKPPAFDQLEGKTDMLETGIKVIDLLTPYVQGGKIGLFGGAGVGKTVLINQSPFQVIGVLQASGDRGRLVRRAGRPYTAPSRLHSRSRQLSAGDRQRAGRGDSAPAH